MDELRQLLSLLVEFGVTQYQDGGRTVVLGGQRATTPEEYVRTLQSVAKEFDIEHLEKVEDWSELFPDGKDPKEDQLGRIK